VKDGITYVAPIRGKSVWIGNRELVTFQQTGAQTGGLFALVEVMGLSGSGPPPHIHHREDESFYVLEGEYEFLIEGSIVRVGRARCSTSQGNPSCTQGRGGGRGQDVGSPDARGPLRALLRGGR
jgi:hypothetical protein